MLDTDISKEGYDALKIEGHHLEKLKAWKKYMDVVGISSYPNVFEPAPVKGSVLKEIVSDIKSAWPGKAVYVLETGYPVQYSNPSQSGAYYTEELQAEFVTQAFAAAIEGGADGFFYTGVWSDGTLDHHIVGTAWGRWSSGRATPMQFRILGPCIERNDVNILRDYGEKHGVHASLSFALLEGFEHFGNHYAPNGTAWGLVDPFRKVQRKGFQALAKAYGGVSDLKGQVASIANEITKRHGVGEA